MGPWFAILLVLSIAGCATPAVTSHTKADVAAVLKEHPELILEALKDQEAQLLQLVEAGTQKRERLAKENQRLAELKNPFQPDLSIPRPVRGTPNAPITIVEYADFECPFCAQAHQTVKQIMARYDGQVRFLYKHNPITQIHPMAEPSARYFEAIAKQSHEKAWVFHDRLYESPDLLKQGEAGMDSVVASLGLDTERLRKDLASEDVSAQVQRDRDKAMSFGFQGTPAFLINGVSLRGAYPLEEFVQVIELVRERFNGRSQQDKR
jgi:protein-disulfide isomerase